VAHSVEHVAAPHPHLVGRAGRHAAALIIFISVLYVAALCSLVEEGVQTNQEEHVDHEQRYDPYYDYHYNLYYCSVSTLILALAPGAELLGLVIIVHYWDTYSITIIIRRYRSDVKPFV